MQLLVKPWGKKENTEILNLQQMKQERIIYFQNETNMQHRLAIKMKQKIKKNTDTHEY